MIILKKAAMFGLDARIALAIFGALSVISGAALYSAIQHSKAVALLSGLQEIGKAWDQYYLDTGATVPQNNPLASPTSPSFYDLRSIDLMNNNGVKGWNGPYITGFSFDGNYSLYKNGAYILAFMADDAGWGDNVAWWSSVNSLCTSGKVCGLWAGIDLDGMTLSTLSEVDSMVDNGDGAKLVRFKWFYDVDYGYVAYYKLGVHPNLND